MIWLCRGYRPVRIDMSSTKRYRWETLVDVAERYKRINQQITLEMGTEFFRVNTDDEIVLACKLVASYHNQYASTAPEDDGWMEETEAMEAEAFLTEPALVFFEANVAGQ